jgi:hypothetical protein
VKTPAWFRQQIATHGGQILTDSTTEDVSAQALAADVLTKDPAFAKAIIAEYARKKLEGWTSSHRPASVSTGENGQTDLFPDLPRRLEVSPGRFAAQAVMTRHDWDTALKQAQTKEGNASGYRERVERAHDAIVPLLTDDSMTTAEVWPRQMAPELFAIGDMS